MQLLPRYYRAQLYFKLKQEMALEGQLLYREGDVTDKIYFIKEGEVNLVQQVYEEGNDEMRPASKVRFISKDMRMILS